MLIPIGTDSPVRRTPIANIGLIVVNVLVYMVLGGGNRPNQLTEYFTQFTLHSDAPRLYEFFTYQFLHGSTMHLAGNMLFLAVFGNSVNAKMGNTPYLLFYLAGGVFAGVGFAMIADNPLVGASGAIAAVTTAYLVLFPRSYITFFYWFFFIGKIELPSMLIIVFKIVLWDNVLAPEFGGDGNVAYSAHLAGYAFGFVAALSMLGVRAVPRDHFDMLALAKRWYQRKTFAAAMQSPEAQGRAQYGRVARPINANPVDAAASERMTKITELRMKIAECLQNQDRTAAADYYEKLMELDPQQVLPTQMQIEIANQLYHLKRVTQAAAAYEKYVSNHRTGFEANNARLLLGIIYARDLQQYETAQKYLKQAQGDFSDSRRQEQCKYWLGVVANALGQSGASA